MTSNSSPKFLTNLRRGIIQCFSIGDLKVMSTDLGVDYENLAGDSKEVRVLELISFLNRRGQLAALVQYCVSTRPNYTWPQEDATRSPTSIHVASMPNTKTVILFLASDPTDAARLRFGQEVREIQEKLQLAKFRDRFDLHQRMSVRPVDITQALLDTQPHVVHFSGHGTATGELCFENMVGETHALSSDTLTALFEQFAERINCVVLNACFSNIQANAIVQHIRYVIGMNQELGEQAAIAFTVGFYQALGAGCTIDEAYKLGVVQIRLQGIPEHLTPVLLKRDDREEKDTNLALR